MISKLKMIATVTILLAVMVAGPSTADDLSKVRDRASSDDAQSIKEAFLHGKARALVIRNVEPNKLRVGGREFRVKRNPTGRGCFVYDPRTRFSGVERNLVWLVLGETTAYALNAPSKMVTPGLKWPREDGVTAPSTSEVVAYVFKNKPMTPLKREPQAPQSAASTYTVAEYRIYRAVIDTPMAVTEAEAQQRAAKTYGVTTSEVKKIVDQVQRTLFQNKWFGSAGSEIRHASDWNGQEP